MRRMVAPVMLLLLLVGCTSTQNKIADEAFGRALDQQQTITNDLYMIATQGVVDKCCAAARVAAASGDPETAAQAVKDAIGEYDKITWLTREQQMLTYEMFRIPRRYIWSQRGIGSTLYKDWEETQRRLGDEKPPVK